MQKQNQFYSSFLIKKRGQTVVEAAVALGTVLLILSAIVVSILSSVNNATFIKNQTLAQKYGEQGMEYVRYLRNNDPSTFSSYLAGSYCMGLDANNSPTISPTACNNVANITGVFKRDVTFNPSDPQCGQDSSSGNIGTRVTISVYWTSTKCGSQSFCHSSRLVSCFTTIPNSLKTL